MSKAVDERKIVPLRSEKRLSPRAQQFIKARLQQCVGREQGPTVDAVVLFVEDSPQHRHLRNHAARNFGSEIDNHATRFRCNKEILFCLRSLYWCLPWLRKIHLVLADYQFAERFVDWDRAMSSDSPGPELRLVKHSDFMEQSMLPTFNSQALEARFDYIEGLAEHFVYFNDDFFVGRVLRKDYFFSSGDNLPRYNLDRTYVPHRRKTSRMSEHAKAWCNNSRLLDRVWGKGPARHYPAHVAVPMLKSSWAIARAHGAARGFHLTSNCQFRLANNLYAIGLLVYWNLYLRRGKQRRVNDTLFHDLEPGDLVEQLFRFIREARPALFCINDANYGKKERFLFLRAQRELFPLKAPWEPRAPN
jgi:hypothetical protein